MCGAPEPPVEGVQETASSMTQLYTIITERHTAAEQASLVLIKQFLLTIEQTFISDLNIQPSAGSHQGSSGDSSLTRSFGPVTHWRFQSGN